MISPKAAVSKLLFFLKKNQLFYQDALISQCSMLLNQCQIGIFVFYIFLRACNSNLLNIHICVLNKSTSPTSFTDYMEVHRCNCAGSTQQANQMQWTYKHFRVQINLLLVGHLFGYLVNLHVHHHVPESHQ